jgi:hemolysin activation/secretion protein
VRGYRSGTDAGDNLVTGSLEVRVPLTSPLRIGKLGVNAFIDAGTVYDDGERFADQVLKRGFGGGVWVAATIFRFNVTVARGSEGLTRVHATGNLRF